MTNRHYSPSHRRPRPLLVGLTSAIALVFAAGSSRGDAPLITAPAGRCIFRPENPKALSWRQSLPACAQCEQMFTVEFSTRPDFATIDHAESAHFLSATEFSHAFDDSWRPDMRHCARVQRTYPAVSDLSDPVCWIAGYPRLPASPSLTGSRDGLESPGFSADFAESVGACEYELVIARDRGMTDVTEVVPMAVPSAVHFTNTSSGTASTLGRRFYWTACGINPLNQRSCAIPRAWNDPVGEQCAQITVSSGIGAGGERFDHLDTCVDEVYPAPGGYGNFLRDRSKTLLASQTLRHYHQGGTMSGAASIDTNDYRDVETPEEDPWPAIRSSTRTFESDDPILRNGVTVHYNTGRAYEAIRDVVGYEPKWPHPSLPCNTGNGIVSHVGVDESGELPCRDDAFWLGPLASVHYCLPGPRNADMAVDMDTTAHELGHALIQCNSKLPTDRAYGSMLAEFFGDALSTAVGSRTGRGGDVWLQADRAVPGGIRNLRDPTLKQHPALYEGPYWKPFSSSECRTGDCYHHNATVPGHMFYLLANGGVGGMTNDVTVPPLGLDRAFKIVAHAELVYWGRAPVDLPHVRDGMVAAAQTLYGSDASNAVDLAWRAVNVTEPGAPPPTPQPTPTPSRCGGDCNRDGIVTIDELVTIVRTILADSPDPSACPNGDVNQDGILFVSDAVAAVFNALDGCGAAADSGAIAATSAQGIGRMQLRPAFARPGSSVDVDLLLTNAPTDAVAFQTDILLPRELSLSECTAADRLRHQVTAVRLQSLDGTDRIRIIGIDLQDNTDALGDGTIATCRFSVVAGASYGPHPIQLVATGLSSNRGVTMFPVTQNGTITVTECTPALQIGCTSETAEPNDTLKIRNGKKVDWRWQSSDPIDLGGPEDQHHKFCVYIARRDGLELIVATDVPSGSLWRSSGTTGWRYADRDRGISRVELRRRGSSGTKLRVQLVKPTLIPALPLGQNNAVVVQLSTHRQCWSAIYSDPPRFNDARRFYDENE